MHSHAFGGTIVLILYTVIVNADQNNCTFSLRDEVPVTPLILKYEKTVEFFYPNANNTIRLPKNGKIILQCIDKKFKKFENDHELLIQCVRNDTVRVLRKKKGRWRMETGNYKLKDLECVTFPKSVVRKQSEGRRCYRNSTLFEIGFAVKGQFLKVMIVCFDERNATSVYTWYNNTRLHTGHQSNVRRPWFEHDNMYDFNVSATFNSSYQQKRLQQILKSKSLAKKYVKHDNEHFMARGHLTPKADFVYGCEQAATFHYINAAPQWQIFNGGNWGTVEDKVRKMMAAHQDRYAVITGTYDVATLPDKDDVQRKLYLHETKNSTIKHPVPKFYWKIVYDKRSNKGDVLIGINNPYLDKVPRNYYLCKNVCDKIEWFEMKSNTMEKGFVYCCRMKAFLKATGIENVFKRN